jgi:antitoxin (DNA-binding transcriptional repressor) of toxin-antitoxin stability system
MDTIMASEVPNNISRILREEDEWKGPVEVTNHGTAIGFMVPIRYRLIIEKMIADEKKGLGTS